ncbi:helix-turn-helix domain-containing protein [Collinsella intestinalis]|uniref:helix-turn-helix domain-containing protein n=1 Tax=Collinsella intestinalis TaxID=147207 RepID=UPI00338EEAD2
MKSDIGLTDDQQRVYDLLNAVRPMVVGEILKEVDFSRSKLTKILQQLVSLGVVETSGVARGTKYRRLA